jgi:hypothetical protein
MTVLARFSRNLIDRQTDRRQNGDENKYVIMGKKRVYTRLWCDVFPSFYVIYKIICVWHSKEVWEYDSCETGVNYITEFHRDRDKACSIKLLLCFQIAASLLVVRRASVSWRGPRGMNKAQERKRSRRGEIKYLLCCTQHFVRWRKGRVAIITRDIGATRKNVTWSSSGRTIRRLCHYGPVSLSHTQGLF